MTLDCNDIKLYFYDVDTALLVFDPTEIAVKAERLKCFRLARKVLDNVANVEKIAFDLEL